MDALNWHLVGFQLVVQSATHDCHFTALYSARRALTWVLEWT